MLKIKKYIIKYKTRNTETVSRNQFCRGKKKKYCLLVCVSVCVCECARG
jgi:hypothetical protein